MHTVKGKLNRNLAHKNLIVRMITVPNKNRRNLSNSLLVEMCTRKQTKCDYTSI